jgi:hypothetical protein
LSEKKEKTPKVNVEEKKEIDLVPKVLSGMLNIFDKMEIETSIFPNEKKRYWWI